MAYEFIRGLIDVRSQLAHNVNGGPGYGIPVSAKNGVIIHYSGPPVNLTRSDLDIIKAEAVYHVSKNWGSGGQWASGDGYMYHITIGRNGEKWLTRNLEAALWHCNSWPENEDFLSIHIPIGGDQRATPKQLQALAEVVNDFLAYRRLAVNQLKGHMEVDSTACPGSLMEDFVYPMRAGQFKVGEPRNVDHIVYDVPATHGPKWVIAPIYPRFAMVDDPIAVFGYPITGMQLDGDGNEVQAFEKQIMRHRKGTWKDKHDVHLDLVGRIVAHIRGYIGNDLMPIHWAFHPTDAVAGKRYFKETRHNIGGGFRGYWERYGDLDIFGYPLSEEFQEDGKTVQYFERCRMEWHPQVVPHRFDVLLGLLGTEILAKFGSLA